MARPSNSDLLARYRKKIVSSKRWRKEESYDETWKRLIDMYRGRHYEYFTDEDRILVNMIFSTVNVIAPSISVNYPKITVSAVNPDQAPNAVIAEAVVNYWWRHREIKHQFRRAVKDLLIVGHAWVKVGYRYIEEERIGEDEDVNDPNVPENYTTTNNNVLEDAPFVERLSPFDVFVDPDGTSMDDIKWICHRTRRPVRDVKTDRRYNRAARENIAAVSYSRYSDDEPRHRKINDKDEGYADIYEFYDVRNSTVSVFAEGGETFLIKPQKMPYAFGHPFVMLRNYDVPDQFYPVGDVEAIEPLQRELNATRTQMMNHRKKYARKYLFRETSIDANGRAAMESDEDNVMVPVIGDAPLGDVVQPFPALMNPPEFYNQSSLIEQDINTISGVAEFMRGSVSEIRRTATEVGLLQDAANARTADKLATVENAIANIGRKLLALSQQFLTGVQVARIMGRDGEPIWIKYDRDYIAGDFDFEVVGGSTMPNNESARRSQAAELVAAMMPFVSAGVVDLPKLAAYVLQNGFNVKNPEAFLVPPAPEQAAAGPPQGQGMPPELMAGSPMGGPMPMPMDMRGGQMPTGPGGVPLDPKILEMLMSQGEPRGPGVPMGESIPPELLAMLMASGGALSGVQGLPPEAIAPLLGNAPQ
jgi:hypothetical protein